MKFILFKCRIQKRKLLYYSFFSKQIKLNIDGQKSEFKFQYGAHVDQIAYFCVCFWQRTTAHKYTNEIYLFGLFLLCCVSLEERKKRNNQT